MNYYSHHIGDYRRDTGHLTLLEHGVYRQLLDLYYLSETKIPEETESVYRRLCARTDEEKKAVDTILKEFFTLDSGWKHTRCDKVISEYQGKAERARNNGKLGGRPTKTKVVNSGNPDKTKKKANHKPVTTNQEPGKHTTDDDFEIAYASYPKRPGASKANSLKKWNARLEDGASPEAMIEGVRRYAHYVLMMRTEPRYIKQPETFFGPGEHFKAMWEVIPAASSKNRDDERLATNNALTGRNYVGNDDESRTIDG